MATENKPMNFFSMYDEIQAKYPVDTLKDLFHSLCGRSDWWFNDDKMYETLGCLSESKKYAKDRMSGYLDAMLRVEFDRAMFLIHTLLISIPLEELPLLINDEDALTREVTKWRMKRGL